MDDRGVVVILENNIVGAGIDMIINFEYEKLINVEEKIVLQIEKFKYDGEKLVLKDDEQLLNEEELEKELENMLN